MKSNRSLYVALIALMCILTTTLKADAGFEAKTYKSPKGESLNY